MRGATGRSPSGSRDRAVGRAGRRPRRRRPAAVRLPARRGARRGRRQDRVPGACDRDVGWTRECPVPVVVLGGTGEGRGRSMTSSPPRSPAVRAERSTVVACGGPKTRSPRSDDWARCCTAPAPGRRAADEGAKCGVARRALRRRGLLAAGIRGLRGDGRELRFAWSARQPRSREVELGCPRQPA